MPALIEKYYQSLSENQVRQFSMLQPLYEEWNSRINVISRKDIENFQVHHVLHSLAISKVIMFSAGTTILDVGTGGGFPGIPLAILFPEVQFSLLDSIQKKILVVTEIAKSLDLKNVQPVRSRVEEHKIKYDFVLSRAVTAFPEFVKLTRQNVRQGGSNTLANGIICLKGGDLNDELKDYKSKVSTWDISRFFDEQFFETKKIVYLQV